MSEQPVTKEMITNALAMDSKYIMIPIIISRDRINENREEKLGDFEWLIIKSWVNELYQDILSTGINNYVGKIFSMIEIRIIEEPEEKHVIE